MYKNRVVCTLLALGGCLLMVMSQNTNSPYTRYGYGELRDQGLGKSQSMGGVGIGMRDHGMINPANPASYTAVDSLRFMFDIGISGTYSRFSDQTQHATSFFGNFDYLAMQFPLASWLATSIGVMPFSYSGYNYVTQGRLKDVNSQGNTDIAGRGDTIGFKQTYSGTGGISQLYGGLSVKFLNHFALGVNAIYLFGQNSYDALTNITDSSNVNTQFHSYERTVSLDFRAFGLHYGAQFFGKTGKKGYLTVGAMFQPKVKSFGNYNETSLGVINDTITQRPLCELPAQFGIGASYLFDNRLTVAADFQMQQWKDTYFFGQKDTLNNRIKLSVGAEYMDNPYGQHYWQRMNFRAGFNYSNSYFQVNGYSPKTMAFTLGAGFPVRGSMLNASLEYGIVGSASATSIRQNYLRLSLDITMNELWFFKRKL